MTARKNQSQLEVLEGGVTTELEATIADYLTNVDARTRNRRTREFYRFTLGRVLLPYCRDNGIERMDQLDQRTVDRYAAEVNGRDISPATASSYLRGARHFLKWARGPATPTVPRPRVPKRDLRDQVLTRDEMNALVESAATVRDRTLLELLCSTGLRLGEALSLTADDLDDRGRHGRFVLIRHR